MVGPAVPQSRDGYRQVWQCGESGGELQIELFRGNYADLAPRLARPHLVFGPNAGLAAYPTWLPTLRLLARPGAPPSVFTDLCEEAAERACDALETVGGQPAALRPSLNPFRRPFSSQGRDNAFPSYSNAFIFAANLPPPGLLCA